MKQDTLKDGTEVEVIICPVWCDLALVKFEDGQEEFISKDMIEEAKMKQGQIITHKGKIYQLIAKRGAIKEWWEARHLASKSIVEIEIVKE